MVEQRGVVRVAGVFYHQGLGFGGLIVLLWREKICWHAAAQYGPALRRLEARQRRGFPLRRAAAGVSYRRPSHSAYERRLILRPGDVEARRGEEVRDAIRLHDMLVPERWDRVLVPTPA